MAIIDKITIYSYFQTDDFPTEEQFRATWDSFWHKYETIPVSQINGLNELFQQTATITQLNQKANKDGSNIDVYQFTTKLGLNNLLPKGNYTGTAQTLKQDIEQRAILKTFNSRSEFPAENTLSNDDEDHLYLARFEGELYVVRYIRADLEDPGFGEFEYKKI